MIRIFSPCLILAISFASFASSQDKEKKPDDDKKSDKLVSGPQKDANLPGPCEVFNFNGAKGKERIHCPVCEFGPDPVIMAFVREPAEGKDGPLNKLIERMDAAVEKNKDSLLHAVVIILSPAARKPVADQEAEGISELLDETTKRTELYKRLRARAEKVKSVIIACDTLEGPKKYNINPKAEATVIFYKMLKVVDNYAFADGAMTEADADAIVDSVDKTLSDARKRMPVKVKG